MSKLVIFDGNALIHRAYHAIPSSIKTPNGEPINAVYGVLSMLLRVVQDLEPNYLVFAWDRPEPTFRHKLLEDYQGHRPDVDDELISQFPKAQKIIKSMNIIALDKKGFEADDVIGTISKQIPLSDKGGQASGNDVGVIIVTGDRDILQLVDKDIKLYMPERGMSGAKLYGKRETVERLGVPPEQIIDYKALVGDPSDNYKGVPGIGPVTATKLLKKYKTLDNIYKNIDKITGSAQKKLIENKDSAYLSFKLATIVRDVDIDFDLKKADEWKMDSEEALKIYDEYGFRSLKKRLLKFEQERRDSKQAKLF